MYEMPGSTLGATNVETLGDGVVSGVGRGVHNKYSRLEYGAQSILGELIVTYLKGRRLLRV